MSIDNKVLELLSLAIESAADNDESIDRDRQPELLEYQCGAEVCSPAYLSGYDSRGDAPPTLQKVIDRCYELQNDEWKRQYPDRDDLWESHEHGDPDVSQEAEEWLDAALSDEYAFLQIEVTYDDSTVKWESRFTNEYNGSLGHVGRGEIDLDDFIALDDAALAKLAEQIAEAAYDYATYGGDCGQCEGTGTIEGGLGGDQPDEQCPVCDGRGEGA